mgnify:CR=1 FL=1
MAKRTGSPGSWSWPRTSGDGDADGDADGGDDDEARHPEQDVPARGRQHEANPLRGRYPEPFGFVGLVRFVGREAHVISGLVDRVKLAYPAPNSAGTFEAFSRLSSETRAALRLLRLLRLRCVCCVCCVCRVGERSLRAAREKTGGYAPQRRTVGHRFAGAAVDLVGELASA